MRNILVKAGIEDNQLNYILNYLREYSDLEVSRDEDMVKARNLRASFGELFQFSNEGNRKA
jgi:hypothetical protein